MITVARRLIAVFQMALVTLAGFATFDVSAPDVVSYSQAAPRSGIRQERREGRREIRQERREGRREIRQERREMRREIRQERRAQ